MLRLPLIIGAIALLALPFGAAAQDKSKGKTKVKLCADGAGTSAASRDGCLQAKGINTPALQIGGSSFGASGSPFQGGASGNSLTPKLKESPLRPPTGGGLPVATPRTAK